MTLWPYTIFRYIALITHRGGSLHMLFINYSWHGLLGDRMQYNLRIEWLDHWWEFTLSWTILIGKLAIKKYRQEHIPRLILSLISDRHLRKPGCLNPLHIVTLNQCWNVLVGKLKLHVQFERAENVKTIHHLSSSSVILHRCSSTTLQFLQGSNEWNPLNQNRVHHIWTNITDFACKTTNRKSRGPTPDQNSLLNSRITLLDAFSEFQSQITIRNSVSYPSSTLNSLSQSISASVSIFSSDASAWTSASPSTSSHSLSYELEFPSEVLPDKPFARSRISSPVPPSPCATSTSATHINDTKPVSLSAENVKNYHYYYRAF